MAWDDDMVELLRVMVTDLGATPKYADDTLTRVILGAARVVSKDALFATDFAVDLANQTLSPDPTSAPTRDDNWVNLVCMRAAAIIDQGVVRTESGIVIRDNGSMVDLRAKLSAALELVKDGWLAQYRQSLWDYKSGLVTGSVAGAVVMGPFRAFAGEYYGCQEDFSPRRGADYY